MFDCNYFAPLNIHVFENCAISFLWAVQEIGWYSFNEKAITTIKLTVNSDKYKQSSTWILNINHINIIQDKITKIKNLIYSDYQLLNSCIYENVVERQSRTTVELMHDISFWHATKTWSDVILVVHRLQHFLLSLVNQTVPVKNEKQTLKIWCRKRCL